ncbi:unnamed protein product [Lymnaea stagnalis]|uniref:Uncharacterized protein n=1 Tax=Lymnaea stagnalis TaxID=6523 RepID=A0AAV2HS79_LYMST
MGSGIVEFFKKNSKFESFLKRTFSEEAFERVRAYESCVVVSEKENKAFKFIVLSDERIYLTENPPKTVEEAVHLRDVVSVELVNEFPDFLRGKERFNTQHIAVTYMTSEPRRRSLRRSKKSPRGSVTDLSLDRSNASTPLGYANSIEGSYPDLGYITQSAGSLPLSRPTSRGSVKTGAQPKKKKKPQGLNDSFDHESNLRSLKEEREEDIMETIEENHMPSPRSRAPSIYKHSPTNNLKQTQTNRAGLTAKNGSVKNRNISESDILSLDSTSCDQPQQSKLGGPSASKLRLSEAEVQKLLGQRDTTVIDKEESPSCCFFGRGNKGNKNQVSPATNSIPTNGRSVQPELSGKPGSQQNFNSNNLYGGSQLSGQIGPGFLHPDRSSSLFGSRSGTPLLEAERNLNNLNMSSSDLGSSVSFHGLNSLSVDGLHERRKCVLNIYILNLTSHLILLIRSAWNNYIIKSTLALEPETFEFSTDPKVLCAFKKDQVERDYIHLKRDLFKTDLSIEEKFTLIDQLYNTTKCNFVLKKLFWKQPDMFTFLIKQLQNYVPHSKASLTTSEGKAKRADEVELSILILSTINLMLRESEILSSRLHTLKLEGGKLVRELIKMVVSQPDFPYQPLSLTKHWTTPVIGAKDLRPVKNVDEELYRLKTEYTKTAFSTLFELLMVAKMAPVDEFELLSVTGIITTCKELKATEQMVDNLVSQIMELVSLSRFELLTPAQSMLVFQMFTLLLTLLEENKAVISQVRDNYYEEFKYFIQAPAVSKKLPAQYPITATTVNIIDQVVSKVLGNQVQLSSKDI